MPRARTILALSALLGLGAVALGASAAEAAPVVVHAATRTPLAVAQDWAWHHYGSFAVKTVHGSGDDVVALPKGVKAAVVTASTDGQANFVVWTLDRRNHDQDLLVNTIGAYSGSDGFGLDRTTSATKLQVTADGDWTITVRPVWRSTLLPSSHTGDGVYLYDHAAGSMRFTNSGDENFVVWQHTGSLFSTDLLVNEIGAYRGTVPYAGGPSVFEITSSGHWTATRR